MKIKKVLLGLVFMLGVVAVFTVMPKQVNAASEVMDEQTTAVVGESSEDTGNPFINFYTKIGKSTNWERILFNKLRHGKR